MRKRFEKGTVEWLDRSCITHACGGKTPEMSLETSGRCLETTVRAGFRKVRTTRQNLYPTPTPICEKSNVLASRNALRYL